MGAVGEAEGSLANQHAAVQQQRLPGSRWPWQTAGRQAVTFAAQQAGGIAVPPELQLQDHELEPVLANLGVPQQVLEQQVQHAQTAGRG